MFGKGVATDWVDHDKKKPATHWESKYDASQVPLMQVLEHGTVHDDAMPGRETAGGKKQVYNGEVVATLARFGWSPGAAFGDTMHFDFIEGYNNAVPGGRSGENMKRTRYPPEGDLPDNDDKKMICRARFVVLALAVGCSNSQSRTEAAPASKQPPNAPKAAATGHGDVTPSRYTFVIGMPRLQIGDDTSLGGIAVSVHGNIVAAEDSHSLALFELATGELTQRIGPTDDNPGAQTPAIALSPDGNAVAIGATKQTQVFVRPFDKPAFTTPCITPRAFSHDSKLLVCHVRVPEVWSVPDRKLVVKAPDNATVEMPQGAQFTADNKAVVWATDHEIVKWDLGINAISTVYKSADEITNAVFAANGGQVFISSHPPGTYKRTGSVVDLASGKATTVGESLLGAVSPSGARVAVVQSGEVRVLDVAGSKLVWSEKTKTPVKRIAFAADDDVLAYVEGGRIHVVDVAKGQRTYDAPSRFAGWVSEGVIATQRDKLERFDLVKQAWSALDKPPADATVAGAPGWATWRSTGVAAEPAGTTCSPKLRVWTPNGGDKTLAATCPDNSPGWMIGGGWVVAVANTIATVFDAATGKTVAKLPVEKPRVAKPEFARQYYAAALAPNALALLSRGPQLPPPSSGDPHQDAMHQIEPRCEVDATGECWLDFAVTVYSLDKTAKQLWQAPVANDRSTDLAPQASVIALDHAGKRVLVGTADGAIMIATSATATTVKRMHYARITRIVVSPGDGWAFSEDAAGNQRVWKLP